MSLVKDPLMNMFHHPVGDLEELFVEYAPYNENATDYVLHLPFHVSELVFSKLLPTDLDAARYVCKAWWYRIMSSSQTLAQSIRNGKPYPLAYDGWPKPTKLQRSGRRPSAENVAAQKARHHNLIKLFDKQVKEDFNNSLKTWRLPYTQHHFRFILPEQDYPREYQQTRSPFVAIWLSIRGGLLIFLIENDPVTEVSKASEERHCASRIVIYIMPMFNEIKYLGFTECIHEPGPFKILEASQTVGTWDLKVQVGSRIIDCTVESSKALLKCREFTFGQFTQNSVRRRPRNLASPEDALFEFSTCDEPSSQFPEELTGRWQVIEVLPTYRNYTPASRGLGRPDLSPHLLLAKEPDTGDLTILRFAKNRDASQSVDTNSSWHPVATLISPVEGWIWKNIAIEPQDIEYKTFRIAVIWQNPYKWESSELYIYSICKTVGISFNSECRPLKAESDDSTDDGIPFTAQIRKMYQEGHLMNQIDINGKRVRSLDWKLGGIHLQSDIYKSPRFLIIREAHINLLSLGGLQLCSREADRFIFVWGASETGNNSQLDLLKIKHFNLSKRVGGSYRCIQAFTCTCPLHDTNTHVQIPKPLPPHFPEQTGKLESFDLPIVKMAQKRTARLLEARIRELQQAGKSNEAIVNQFRHANWSLFGLEGMPAGWEDWKGLPASAGSSTDGKGGGVSI